MGRVVLSLVRTGRKVVLTICKVDCTANQSNTSPNRPSSGLELSPAVDILGHSLWLWQREIGLV